MSEVFRISLIIGLSLGLAWIDLSIPLGIAIGVLYAWVVLLSAGSSNPRLPIAVGISSTLCIVLGALLSRTVDQVPGWMVVANRFLSLFIIWVSVFFLVRRRRDVEALRRAQSDLELRVIERTRELADLNKALVTEITERIETERSLRVSETALSESRLALQRREKDLRGLTARLLTAQEEERRRISRDLHDDMTQRLAMIVVELETLEQALPPGAQPIGSRLRSLQDNAAELCEDLRHLAYQFHPSVLDDLGLPVALQRLVDDTAARAGLQGCFHSQAGLEPLPQPVATCLYRVAQEGLNNVAKHAQATSFEVRLAQDEHAVTLTIMDNGLGFDASTPRPGRSTLGLVSMKERVHLVQGMLEIQSAMGQGTNLCARVPLMPVAP